MDRLHSHIRPNTYLFLRLPSDTLKLVDIKANSIIDAGKIGNFPSDLLLGRPYYHTFEILERQADESFSRLRVVPPSQLNVDVVAEYDEENAAADGASTPRAVETLGAEVVAEMKNNRLTVDDASRQALTHVEIEELKKSAAGKEIIEKILANHAGLDEKTAFSKAKYMVRKRQKYLKRFTVLPMDMGNLMDYISEKEPQRILDMRHETLGLITAWSNVHVALEPPTGSTGGRHLVIDDTGGLVVAALAERMGILFADSRTHTNSHVNGDAMDTDGPLPKNSTSKAHRDFPLPMTNNTITVLHPAVQPNVSMLTYFGYNSNNPDHDHPLHTRLQTLSWLQLLHPEEDTTYCEPETATEETLQQWKTGKRSAYWRKRRRWERCKAIVDQTRDGGFESLVIASTIDPTTIFPHAVPLVRGGGQVVVYSPAVEPLVKLMDLYSKDRRTAYVQHLSKGEALDPKDFPVDPRLLLSTTLQTSRVREWQVLPGRTHPLMTSKGGPEGFVFTATRVVPVEGGVEARGNFSSKKRKMDSTDIQ